ncbi:MAG: translation elongation factor Ts [Candidatus Dojkabacteria bacterium]
MAISAQDIMLLRQKTSAGIGLCKEALEATNGDMAQAIEYVNKRSDVVSRIHNLTGAKLGLIKIALQDAEQDFEKAMAIIKERGWETESVEAEGQDCAKGDGVIGVYVHGVNRKTVALVEVQCNTDFVARNEKFVDFANELAKQAAAMKPEYVSVESIPAEKLEELKALFKREAEEEGKPANIMEKIIEGKLNKYYSEKCLLNQKWFKDESKTMNNYLDETIGALGEPIVIRRLLVWEWGSR